MNCPKCSAEVPTGSPFCTSCGQATGDASAATVSISLLDLEDPLLKALREALALEYYVERELGRGGMAIVFKAKEIGLERPVALKVLPPEMAMMGGTADRFKREARLAASLDHPNIIPIYRVGQAENFHYMAMKFVEGRAVDSMLQSQGALPIPVVVRILRDAAAGLAYGHDAGIIHRDVKGGNILVDKTDGRVMMSDFGIARAAGEASLTASGMMVGTPAFMSPEQCGAGAVVPQSDQYSLGIMGFQLLTGQLPFEAESLVEVIQHHYMTPPPDMREVRKEIPDELYQVIYKALAKQADERFATTHDMVEALDAVPITAEEKREATAILKQLASGEKVGEVRTGSLPPAKLKTGALGKLGSGTREAALPQKSRTGILVGAVIGVVGLAGAGAWVVLGQKAAPPPASEAAVPVNPMANIGGVRLSNVPANARVIVGDKVIQGNSGQLPAGQYQYSIEAPGYRTFTGTVQITAGQTAAIVASLTPVARATPTTGGTAGGGGTGGGGAPPAPVGTTGLRVAASQSAAEIFLDDQRLGAGRVVQDIPAGRHTVRITLVGFQTWDTTFVAKANEPVNLGRVELKPQ